MQLLFIPKYRIVVFWQEIGCFAVCFQVSSLFGIFWPRTGNSGSEVLH